VEQQDAREDEWDEEIDYVPRSIFAAGWFRAVLVLTGLAVALVVALPYLVELFEPTPTVVRASPPVTSASKVAVRTDAPSPSADSTAPAAPMPTAAPAPAVAPPLAATAPSPAPERARVSAPVIPSVRATESPTVPRAERVAAVTPKPSAARVGEGGRYWVQLGVFKDSANADLLAQRVREQGFPVEVTRVMRSGGGSLPAGAYHLVRAGGFRDQPHALAANRELRDKGFPGFVAEGVAQ